jgi:hypothetical protein
MSSGVSLIVEGRYLLVGNLVGRLFSVLSGCDLCRHRVDRDAPSFAAGLRRNELGLGVQLLGKLAGYWLVGCGASASLLKLPKIWGGDRDICRPTSGNPATLQPHSYPSWGYTSPLNKMGGSHVSCTSGSKRIQRRI